MHEVEIPPDVWPYRNFRGPETRPSTSPKRPTSVNFYVHPSVLTTTRHCADENATRSKFGIERRKAFATLEITFARTLIAFGVQDEC